MPCKTCYKIFKIKPCDHPSGIFKHKTEVYHYKDTMIYDIERLYKRLYDECPCKECLVRPACVEGRSCMPFMIRITLRE